MLLGTGPITWAKCNNAHCGNIGEDCEVDIGDVVLALRASVGLEQLNEMQSDAADVAPGEEIDHWNGVRFSRPVGDGTVDIADVVILLRMSVELEMLDGCWGPDVQSVVPVSPARMAPRSPRRPARGSAGTEARLFSWTASRWRRWVARTRGASVPSGSGSPNGSTFHPRASWSMSSCVRRTDPDCCVTACA
jgi:hypothetical protein